MRSVRFSRYIFEHLGFVIAETITPAGVRDTSITPPNTDPSTSEGRQSGRRLLRFWVETSAWLLDYQRRHGTCSLDFLTFADIFAQPIRLNSTLLQGYG